MIIHGLKKAVCLQYFYLLIMVVGVGKVESFFVTPVVKLVPSQGLRPASHQDLWHLKLQRQEEADDSERIATTRRTLFKITASIPLIMGGLPSSSWALKERNEQLCGTGLFTNFLEYRCTDIGDISDEGQKTTFSASEAGAADSLLSKFNLDASDITTEENMDNNNPNGNKRAGGSSSSKQETKK